MTAAFCLLKQRKFSAISVGFRSRRSRASDFREMATQNAQPQQQGGSKTLDVIVVTLAVLIAAAGLLAFTFLTDQSTGVRIGALIGGLVVAVVVAAFSSTGKRFIAFCRESWEELRRVVWPTRKETVNTTGIVMAFVVAVAFYLFFVDMLIEWGLYDGLLKLSF